MADLHQQDECFNAGATIITHTSALIDTTSLLLENHGADQGRIVWKKGHEIPYLEKSPNQNVQFRNHTPGFRNLLTLDAEASLRTSDRRVLRVDTKLLDKSNPPRDGSTFIRTRLGGSLLSN